MTTTPLPTPASLESAAPEIGSEFAPHLSFLQQPAVQKYLPLATSLSIHLTIVLIGLIVFAGTRQYAELASRAKEQVIVPEASLIENAPIGGVPNPGLGGDPDRASAQDQIKDIASSSTGWATGRNEGLAQGLMGGANNDASESVIGIGNRNSMGSGGAGSGSGTGTGPGNADDGGLSARFGVPGGGGGIGPRANFIGISGNAMKVAYVCDSSGSMMNLMFALKSELRKAIDILKPIQAFNIIFFSDETKPQALNAGGLVMANADTKRKAYDFLNSVSTSGATNPIPGLELAFKAKPQLIYVLTDGNFPDNDAVLKRVRDLNRDKTTKINTILFCDAATIEKGIVELLQQVATENGGVFKLVDTKDY